MYLNFQEEYEYHFYQLWKSIKLAPYSSQRFQQQIEQLVQKQQMLPELTHQTTQAPLDYFLDRYS